jgi:peptide deformylase
MTMYELKIEPYDMLHRPVKPFEFNSDTDPAMLENQMIDLMIKNRGIGLAANQIGLNSQVFVIGSKIISGFIQPQAFFNPVITKVSETSSLDEEGCLSFPGLMMKIKRPTWIEASYQNIKGEWVHVKADGYLAKVFQHEFDHLHGICFTDRAGKLKVDMAIKKLLKKRRK